jgi:hypothetical protein
MQCNPKMTAIPLTSVPKNFTIRPNRIESSTTAVLLGIEHLGSLGQDKSRGYTAKSHGVSEPAHNPMVPGPNPVPALISSEATLSWLNAFKLPGINIILQ